MRRVLLAIAVGFSSGPSLLQAFHAFAHEHRVSHHHHDADADRHDDDAGHSEMTPSAVPSVLNAAPRVDVLFARVATPVDCVVVGQDGVRHERLRDLGPPHHPPGRLLSAVPSNRAPPA